MDKTISKKFKIAVVVPKYGLVGGGEKFVAEVTERIARDDRFEMHVFANRWKAGSGPITFHQVPVITFPRFLTTISFAHFANRAIAKMDFDLIHTHERIFRADIFSMHSVPHRFWVREIRQKGMSLFDYGTSWVESVLINKGNCRKFLPVSTLAREKILKDFPIDREKIDVIHPGVDIGAFRALNKEDCRREIGDRFGIGKDDRVILFVSMNFELKGLDALMTALSMTKTRHPSAHLKLLVVGKGNYRKYGALARKLSIEENVIFTGVQTSGMEKIYSASDIFVMLSRFDTFGMAVLEAMSASVPVIVSHNVGAKDLVTDGHNGFVVDHEDVDTIAAKIAYMLDERARRSMAEDACRVAVTHDWDRVVERTLQVYDEIVGCGIDAHQER